MQTILTDALAWVLLGILVSNLDCSLRQALVISPLLNYVGLVIVCHILVGMPAAGASQSMWTTWITSIFISILLVMWMSCPWQVAGLVLLILLIERTAWHLHKQDTEEIPLAFQTARNILRCVALTLGGALHHWCASGVPIFHLHARCS